MILILILFFMLFLLLELTLRTKLLKQRICSTLGHIIEFDVNDAPQQMC
jgi:hypothetical protein